MTLFSIICFSNGIKDWKILNTNKITKTHYLIMSIITIGMLLFTSYDVDLNKFVKKISNIRATEPDESVKSINNKLQ